MDIFILILAAVILILVIIFFLQSRIRTGAFEEYFPIRQSEPARVMQHEDGTILLTWEANLSPEAIRLLDAPDAEKAVQTWDPPFSEHRIEVKLNPVHFRPFFHLQLPEQPDLLVSTRFQPFEQVRNFRDMGGYRTASGGQVAWGKLYRSGQLGKANETDQQLMQALGLRTIIDLRDDEEVAYLPDAFPEPVAHRRVFITNNVMVTKTSVMVRRQRLGHEFREGYKNRILEGGAAGIGQVFRLLADEANLPAVIHCTAGKDRAGVISALVLLTLGVPEETVIADYTLSNRFAETFIEEIERRIRKVRWLGMRTEHFFPMAAARPGVLESTLAYLRETYGSAEGYLTRRAGVPQEDLERLKKTMLLAVDTPEY